MVVDHVAGVTVTGPRKCGCADAFVREEVIEMLTHLLKEACSLGAAVKILNCELYTELLPIKWY